MAEIKLTEDEIQAATEVLRSGALRQGKQCEAFESEFAAKVGARHAVSSANGSAALHLIYMSYGFEPGDEVLVPAFTFIATASMPAFQGLKPVFCDVDPNTFLLDLAHAETLVTERTRAIAPVHLYGNPCDCRATAAFAERHGLKVVWDAAQSHGAELDGRDVGSHADVVSYSFYPSKNMFVGEGGITVTDDEQLDNTMRFMRTHGQVGKYYHTMLGLNYRMTDVEAAIGRKQLERLDGMLAVRRRNAAILDQGLANVPGIAPQRTTEGGTHAYHLYCVRVSAESFGMDRDALSKALMDRDIHSGVHYPRPLHKQPVFEERWGAPSLPVSERLAEEILAIPVHHGLSADDARAVVDAIRSIHEAN